MTDKLTLADCYKYNKATITSVPLTHMFSDVRVLIEYAHENMLTIQEIIDFNNLKLILRDISQLTDDEKIYINDNLFYPLFKNTVSLNANAVWNSFDELLASVKHETALIDYLRGNNILIEPEDWFKSGKAVKG